MVNKLPVIVLGFGFHHQTVQKVLKQSYNHQVTLVGDAVVASEWTKSIRNKQGEHHEY